MTAVPKKKFDYRLDAVGAGSADNLLKMAEQQASHKEKKTVSTFAPKTIQKDTSAGEEICEDKGKL